MATYQSAYSGPQIDEAIGKALDIDTTLAAAVGAVKSELGYESDKSNYLHNLINYGYETDANMSKTPSSTTATQIGVVRRGAMVTLDGTNTQSSNIRIKVNGTVARTISTATIDGWTDGALALIAGHTYVVSTTLISGSSSNCSVSVYKVGTHNSVATTIESTTGKHMAAKFKADGSSYNICLFVGQNYTYTNARFLVLLEDVTDQYLYGYQRLEYLESSGAQRVSMGLKLNNNSRVLMQAAFASIPLGGSANQMFGARSTTSEKAFGVSHGTTGKLYVGYGAYKTIDRLADTDIHIYDLDKTKFFLDGKLLYTYDAATFTSPADGMMFAASGANTFYYGSVRIYACKVYSNGTLVRDFVPVKRLRDGVLGMYDLVNDSFYTNEGSGVLIAGEEITERSNWDEIVANRALIQQVKRTVDKSEAEYKDYIQTEADRVADKVRNVQTGKTLTYIACSDLHYSVDNVAIRNALDDMANGIKAIADQVHIDFYACFGDIIYRLSTDNNGDFDKGKAEAIGVTKIINSAFINNDQIRLVGNHDPNAEADTGYFTPDQLNAFLGIYSNMLTRPDGLENQGVGYCDFEDRKARIIAVNTSYYASTPTQNSTQYSFGDLQAYELCKMLDLSDKEDADEWQIFVFGHVSMDTTTHTTVSRYSAVFYAYQNGGTWTRGSYSYSFSGKNQAQIAMYINGHAHRYQVKNLNYVDAGVVVEALKIAQTYVPNALPERDEESVDGVIYTKTANTAESTAFQVMTIDFDSKVLYAHHYGAGIDIVFNYDPVSVSTSTVLTTTLNSPVWNTKDSAIATVSNGTVTKAASGSVIIWAKSEADNTIEAWNILCS